MMMGMESHNSRMPSNSFRQGNGMSLLPSFAFLLFLTGPLLVFLVVIFLILSVQYLTRCWFCTVKSRRWCTTSVPPLTLTDTSGMSWQAAIMCYLLTHLHVGSISNLSALSDFDSTTTISVSSQVKLEQLSPPPTM
jgi:hypothetical protein